MSVYENSDFIKDQIRLTQIAGKKKTPVLGICLGSQIIAQSSGERYSKDQERRLVGQKL